jgi:shikimate kinase
MGFMGSGKTRWGKQLANKLGLAFVDLDKSIEEIASMTVTEIFRHKGEALFRQLETKCLNDVLAEGKAVISLGGGTPCDSGNMKMLEEKATTVYLKSNAGMLYSRLIANYKSRPLLTALQPEELLPFIQTLLAQREPWYSQANVTVNVEGLTTEKLAAAVQSTK